MPEHKTESTPNLKCVPLNEVERKEIKWLWKNRIPKGAITLLEGNGGQGKSTIVAELCSKLSAGVALPDDLAQDPMNVLLLAAEDDPSCVLRPRFEAHGADLSRVRFDDQAMLLNEVGIQALIKAVNEHSIDVVVIDPVVAFLGQKIDMNKGNDVRSVLGPLAKVGRETGCTFLIVRHFNKNRDGAASQRGAGSVDFRNAARSVLQVIQNGSESFLALEKSNYAAQAPTLKFAIVNGCIEWRGQSGLSADEILSQSRSDSCQNASDLDEAIDFLEQELQEGPRLSREIESGAKSLGISQATLKRAKRKLGVKAFKIPGQNAWYCEIRGDEDQAQSPRDNEPDPDPHPLITYLETKNAV